MTGREFSTLYYIRAIWMHLFGFSSVRYNVSMLLPTTRRSSKRRRIYANTIRSYRLRVSRTQRAVAAALGVRQPTLSLWERGVTYPNPKQMMRLARELGTLVEHLYSDYYWLVDREVMPALA